eukprot:SAG31_NODE_450_length_15512_cov_5.788555_21_plen_68_part_00
MMREGVAGRAGGEPRAAGAAQPAFAVRRTAFDSNGVRAMIVNLVLEYLNIIETMHAQRCRPPEVRYS